MLLLALCWVMSRLPSPCRKPHSGDVHCAHGRHEPRHLWLDTLAACVFLVRTPGACLHCLRIALAQHYHFSSFRRPFSLHCHLSGCVALVTGRLMLSCGSTQTPTSDCCAQVISCFVGVNGPSSKRRAVFLGMQLQSVPYLCQFLRRSTSCLTPEAT